MTVCPRCKDYYPDRLKSCPKCDKEFEIEANHNADNPGEGWIVVGRVKDQTSSDYVRETLESYDIPAVIISESGFFGQAGLNLPSPTGKHMGMFQIHVPADRQDDAINVLNMILGDSWEKVD